MKNLLYKEFKLAMHPTVILFLLLSALLLVPNYPYYITFFYTCLGLFFICLTGRECHDIGFTMSLPVKKSNIVLARMAFCICIEALQMILAIPFALIRQGFNLPGNQVGMDANIAFFGFSFILLGVFNYFFFTMYYKDPDKVGKSFFIVSAIFFIFMCLLEALDHIVPIMRDKLDTPDPQFIGLKLVTLVVGFIVYLGLTFLAYKKLVSSFEQLDL